MSKVYFYFSLCVVTLILLGCLLSTVIFIAAPEVMSKITSSVSERWQATPAEVRIGIGVLAAAIGIVVLPTCLDLALHAPFGESSRMFDEDISRDFYHGP